MLLESKVYNYEVTSIEVVAAENRVGKYTRQYDAIERY